MKALLTLLFFTLSLSLLQGQWIREKGTGYYKLGGWSLLANEHFTDQGKVDPNATRGLFISSLYAQIGLSKKINIIAYVPFLVKNYQFAQVSKTNGNVYEPRQEFSSFGDTNIGFEYGLKSSGKWVFSTTLTLGIPSGRARAGLDGSYQTGDGEFNQLIQANIGSGYRLGEQTFYLKSYIGYNNRSQNFSDELHSYFETGSQFWEQKLLVLTRLHWIKPLYNRSLDASNANGAIFANNIESFILGGEMALNIGSKWGISAALAHPLFGKVIYRASSFSSGVFISF